MPTSIRRRGPWAFTIAALVAAMLPLLSAPAHADVVELPVPADRCIASVAAGFGLSQGIKTPADGIELEVPGPVIRVIVEWTGRDDADSGVSALDIEVDGPHGSSADRARAGTLIGSDNTRIDGRGTNVYSWWADITDLLAPGGAGTYRIDVEPFATPGIGISWGGVVTAVYDTAPCTGAQDALWKMGADYFFGGRASSGTTELLVYDWEGAPTSDLTVTVRAAHGGADSGTQLCRMSSIWAAIGTGPAPAQTDTLVDAQGNAALPGASRIVSNPFSPPAQSCPPAAVAAPATALRGGNVGPEYTLVEVDLLVPAGSEWLAVQFESPRDNGGYRGLPESGAWAGGSVLHIPSFADPAPAIDLEKTILDTAKGSCPGAAGVAESVDAEPGDPVTYCFRVTNPGTTPLFPVHVNDAALGIDEGDMVLVAGDASAPLLLGGELVYAYETTASNDLENTATATGTPSDAAGVPLDLADVTATDRATLVVLEPGLAVSKTVLFGHAAACPGTAGVDELVAAARGAAITYCFAVANTGEVDLEGIAISDPELGATTSDLTLVAGEPANGLQPGEAAVWSLATHLDSDLASTATATATTADDRIATSQLTATDTAAVIVREGGVELVKSVLPATESCDPGAEPRLRVDGLFGAEVRYCFVISNTGTVPLSPIMVDDPALGITKIDLTPVAGDPARPLPPGGSLVLDYVDVIEQSQTSTATVTAMLADQAAPAVDPAFAATAAAAESVTASATTTVGLLEPALTFDYTAVAGHGSSCAAGAGATELALAAVAAPVTFCFVVTNTGDTALWPVEVKDATSGAAGADVELISGDDASPLLPGATLVYAWRTTAAGDAVNIGSVTATAASPAGEALAPTTTLRAERLVRVSILQEELPATGAGAHRLAWIAASLLMLGAASVVASQGGLSIRRRRPS